MFEKLDEKMRRKRRMKAIAKQEQIEETALLNSMPQLKEISNKSDDDADAEDELRKSENEQILKDAKNESNVLNPKLNSEMPLVEIDIKYRRKQMMKTQMRPGLSKGRKKVSLHKLQKEIKKQVKNDSIPDPIKWDEVDLDKLFEKSETKTSPKEMKKVLDGTKKTTQRKQKSSIDVMDNLDRIQERKLVQKQLEEDDYKDSEFDFSHIGDQKTMKNLEKMNIESFGSFNKKKTIKKTSDKK